MTGRLDQAVELLDRSLAHTRVALAGVGPTDLARRTPCERWDLAALLAHMDDALDAFLEAAAGAVAVGSVPVVAGRVPALREKACALLGAWTRAEDRPVLVAGVAVPAELLVVTAALEITVHGWDVAVATGAGPELPTALASGLLPYVEVLVAPEDRVDLPGRPARFGAQQPVTGAAGADVRLLAALGRRAHVRTG